MQGGSALGYPLGWDPATGLDMPPGAFITSTVGQTSASASQPIGQQQNASASQPMTQNVSASQPMGQINASASQLIAHQQNLAALIQPMTHTEILISRLPHRNGVNWVFHDPMAGTVRRVNVPYLHPMAQQSINQAAQQMGVNNEMVLYQQPPAQIAQHTPQMTSATQLRLDIKPARLGLVRADSVC